MSNMTDIKVPLTVPHDKNDQYKKHYATITRGTGRLFLFAGDQKIEHLNEDFYGVGIAEDAADPEHLFRIASQAPIGAFATQLGMIARYGREYPTIPYIVKVNSKTNLVTQEDPLSGLLCSIEQIMTFKKQSGLNIVGVGFTLYPGSIHEAVLLSQASQIILKAHQEGLVTVLWSYPRGKSIIAERDAALIAGAAGLATCLGADFVKVNPPQAATVQESALLVQQAARAAGNTGVICSGGASQDQRLFLEAVALYLEQGIARGVAIGRNIHQKPLSQAIKLCQAINALVYEGASLSKAFLYL